MDHIITHWAILRIESDFNLTFSAFGFGWGYVSVTLPNKVMSEALGAEVTTREQTMLVFELNWERIALAIGRCRRSGNCERIRLSTIDF